MPAHGPGSPADPDRDEVLRRLHPDNVRRRARRWRWLRVALAALICATLFVWFSNAHQAAMRATDDNDPAIGSLLFSAAALFLGLCVFVVLLGYALACELRRRGR